MPEYIVPLAFGAAAAGVVALVLNVVVWARVHRFARPFDELAKAARQGGVPEALQAQLRATDENRQRIEETMAYARSLGTQAMNAIQGIGFLRYDAFDDIRGQQSYSLCLLDAHENGLVITNIAGRSDARAYAKQVRAGRCEVALSDEEKEAIAKALESLRTVSEPVLATA
jgi:hypothetical protein